MGRNTLADTVDGVPGGVPALKALAEAVGALVDWPDSDEAADEHLRAFASMVLHDAGVTVRRRRRAVPLAAVLLTYLAVFITADEAGMDRRELWRRVAARVDRLLDGDQ